MEVSFLQGLLGRRRRVSSLGLWKGSFSQSQFEKVRNPLFCWDQWGPMSAGRQMETLYSGYMERKSTFQIIVTMMDEQIQEDHSKLKQGLVKVLQCVATISSAAAVVNPIFGVAGSLIRVVLHHVDDEDIRTLKREFGSVHQRLDELSQQNRRTLVQIEKETLDSQYCHVEENLKNQFRKFMAMVEARPEHRDGKKDDFEESYANDEGDQNLHTLYDGVVGTRKLFSRPILEVYLKHSQGDRRVMERLCTRLTYLFCIGLIALMGYAAIIGDDEEELSEKWTGQMEKVQEKMQEALRKCT
ncbi:protein rapunzel isoform X1 [Xiphophorus hellerii]|uniref:protein rapunzel isoform X1 n=2 Tax=Xiphophorus hellerii TaxID=8084 RepID=UPI0013B45E38|nr:protein rapunzel-like isoform X1 [Xiphophorus hellerii]